MLYSNRTVDAHALLSPVHRPWVIFRTEAVRGKMLRLVSPPLYYTQSPLVTLTLYCTCLTGLWSRRVEQNKDALQKCLFLVDL